METAFVALGSNLGDSAAIVRAAFDLLQTFSDEPLIKSSLWTSEPMDCPPGSPSFVNAVAALKLRPEETPESLLQKLREGEIKFGRVGKTMRNEPRLLDLDLISFGERTMRSEELILPHPRAQTRIFVMGPLAEIAPDFILPGQTKSAQHLVELLKSPL